MTIERRSRSKRARATPSRAALLRSRAWREMNIFEKIEALGRTIPEEELARHPVDGASNLHHYLCGSPKQDPD